MKKFDPVEHGLESSFRLELLDRVGEDVGTMDCSITPSRHKGFFTITTIDFFFPLVNDPYIMGKIAAANVLSDIYACGVVDIDTMLMVLTNSEKMSMKQNDVCLPLLMKGFGDAVKSAGGSVTGGQTVRNEELIIGGVVMSMCSENEFVSPDGAKEGDVLVLTKPLATRIAVNVHQWKEWAQLTDYVDKRYTKIMDMKLITEEEVDTMYYTAQKCMAHLNRNGAKILLKYGHCATDITGFGVLNHAQNLCTNQKEDVDFILEKLPCFKNTVKVTKALDGVYGLFEGWGAETSGGLLIAIPQEKVSEALKEFEELDGRKAHVVGKVVKGTKKAKFSENVEWVEVDF